jgi:hypothetical protein
MDYFDDFSVDDFSFFDFVDELNEGFMNDDEDAKFFENLILSNSNS